MWSVSQASMHVYGVCVWACGVLLARTRRKGRAIAAFIVQVQAGAVVVCGVHSSHWSLA